MLDEAQGFLQSLADDFVQDGAAYLHFGEAAVVGEPCGADRAQRIGGGVALADLEFLGFGKRQAGDEVDVVGDVVAADGDAAGCGDGSVQIECVVGRAAADVDDQRAALALLAVAASWLLTYSAVLTVGA